MPGEGGGRCTSSKSAAGWIRNLRSRQREGAAEGTGRAAEGGEGEGVVSQVRKVAAAGGVRVQHCGPVRAATILPVVHARVPERAVEKKRMERGEATARTTEGIQRQRVAQRGARAARSGERPTQAADVPGVRQAVYERGAGEPAMREVHDGPLGRGADAEVSGVHLTAVGFTAEAQRTQRKRRATKEKGNESDPIRSRGS